MTIRVTAVTGPRFCIDTPDVGSVSSTVYLLVRNGSTVSFNPSDPIDWSSYTASLDGAAFTATIPTYGSGSGDCTHFLQDFSFSGSFSADGNHAC